jgi:hypothetical protein
MRFLPGAVRGAAAAVAMAAAALAAGPCPDRRRYLR